MLFDIILFVVMLLAVTLFKLHILDTIKFEIELFVINKLFMDDVSQIKLDDVIFVFIKFVKVKFVVFMFKDDKFVLIKFDIVEFEIFELLLVKLTTFNELIVILFNIPLLHVKLVCIEFKKLPFWVYKLVFVQFVI